MADQTIENLNLDVEVSGEAQTKLNELNYCNVIDGYDIIVDCFDSYETKYSDSLGHDLVAHAAQNPTCDEIGWDEYVECNRCDYSTYKEIPATHQKTLKVKDEYVSTIRMLQNKYR